MSSITGFKSDRFVRQEAGRMQFPEFYRPEHVGKLYQPDVSLAVAAGLADAERASTAESGASLLLLVDPQVDFIHSDGALSVPGAVDDTRRTIEWIFRNLGEIHTVAASLDSHYPQQIFFSTWWIDQGGSHPAPYTVILPEDVESGKWIPLYQVEWSRAYVARLRDRAKKDLMIWPFHTMLGTPGHAITPALYEAIAYQSAASGHAPRIVIKGTLPETEFYSLLEAEVKPEADERGGLNLELIEWMSGFEQVFVAGQAKSHCVLETLASIVGYYGDQSEAIAKYNLLTDCTSSVQHPEVDFEAIAQETLSGFERQGLHLVDSSTPLE
jgi:nicotinamidase/pyrazinamidase